VADQRRMPYPVGEAQAELERRVADRTAQLALANSRLRHEIRERKQAEDALRKEHQYLQYLIELQERDRQLISCELHDGLVQQLAGAIMRFEMNQMDAGLRMLRECLREARWLIHGLRPPTLDEYGVVAAIEELLSQNDGANQPAIEFFHRIAFDRLPSPLENTVFRIVQECLTNTLRHSQSMKVRVRLVQRKEEIRIKVEDWGVGFNPRKVAEGHYGLEGIKERARLFGGAATIRSSPGKGTRIVVTLPLRASSIRCVATPQPVLN
jgi:signal transduction histidine kinase